MAFTPQAAPPGVSAPLLCQGYTLGRPATVYLTEHHHSQVIGRALAKGAGAALSPTSVMQPGSVGVYGILRGCDDLLRRSWWVGRDTYHVDLGYIGRGHYGGYYRITKNGLQWKGLHPPLGGPCYPASRADALDVDIAPWRKDGRHVVVCPMSSAIGTFYGIGSVRWTQAVIDELSLHTDRPILVKPKESDAPLADILKDAHALVTYNSNAAVEAVLAGVPVFVLGESAAGAVSLSRLCEIEKPFYPDYRRQWLEALACQQFTIPEMERGECWDFIG